MELSTEFIVALVILFVLIGVSTSVLYYFSRYYVKMGDDDKELMTKKPYDIKKAEIILGAEPVVSGPSQSPSVKSQAQPVSVQSALSASRESLWGRLSKLVSGKELSPNVQNEIEEILYTSDLGPNTAELLLAKIKDGLNRRELSDSESVRLAIRTEMLNILESVPKPGDIFANVKSLSHPVVWMLVGVNGAGKTTTLGKLASQAKVKGIKVLIIAADTFRAAADAQLKEWAVRAGCEVFSPENVKDPSAVIYSGLEYAKANSFELVIVDTAGRLHTKDSLMDELKKMTRVMKKILPAAPHETFIVLDANAGQNALNQSREYHAAIELTGAIITKLDGSSKAGVALGVVQEVQIPIVYIGIGEAVEDLRAFDSVAFVGAII